MKIKDVFIILGLFMGFFIFYIYQNPHSGVLKGEEMTMHHMDMIYEDSSKMPSRLKVAESPKYPVGSRVISQADHMGGMMKGVEVRIVGAYESIAYATTYTSTNSGILVEDHKWIVHEEIVDAGDARLESGAQIHTTAEHMKGMKDAIHKIDYSLPTTVYMIDFELANGMKVTNHKWVVEEELVPINFEQN